MRNNNYPDWLRKHLTKGVYANKTAYGYTLYRARSVYDPTTKRPRRISEGVIGTVTEQGGFVPSKKYNVPLDPISVFTYGREQAILTLCDHSSLTVSLNFRYYRNEIIVGSILYFLYNTIDEHDFKSSFLSLHYPRVRFNYLKVGNDIYHEALRYARKLSSTLSRTTINEFRHIYLVCQKDKFTVSGLPLTNLHYKGVDFNYDPAKQ